MAGVTEATNTTLLYIHDPMCSWCWGFRPAYDALVCSLPEGVQVSRIVGGLAPDSSEPMPAEMREYLSQTWRTIQARIPGTRFNFDFWTDCEPRRSTYPACRGVIAARQQGMKWDEKMTDAIQQAYYLEARNPSDDATLVAVAGEIGLDAVQFEADLVSQQTAQTLGDEIDYCRTLGVQGFPSLALFAENHAMRIAVDHTSWRNMLNDITEFINTHAPPQEALRTS